MPRISQITKLAGASLEAHSKCCQGPHSQLLTEYFTFRNLALPKNEAKYLGPQLIPVPVATSIPHSSKLGRHKLSVDCKLSDQGRGQESSGKRTRKQHISSQAPDQGTLKTLKAGDLEQTYTTAYNSHILPYLPTSSNINIQQQHPIALDRRWDPKACSLLLAFSRSNCKKACDAVPVRKQPSGPSGLIPQADMVDTADIVDSNSIQ